LRRVLIVAFSSVIGLRVLTDHSELLTHFPGSSFQESQWKTRDKRMSVRRCPVAQSTSTGGSRPSYDHRGTVVASDNRGAATQSEWTHPTNVHRKPINVGQSVITTSLTCRHPHFNKSTVPLIPTSSTSSSVRLWHSLNLYAGVGGNEIETPQNFRLKKKKKNSQ